MRKKLEEKLQEDYPFMRQTHDINDRSIYRIYGCECSSGWYEIIRECCEAIADKYKQAGIPVDFVPEQIKEKFGTLRFYYGYEDAPMTLAAIDLFGGGSSIRFTPENKEDDEEKKAFRKEIREIVRKAEVKSATTCEFCGQEGELRRDLCRITTLCDTCYEKIYERDRIKKEEE